jgi:hypothetical protein
MEDCVGHFFEMLINKEVGALEAKGNEWLGHGRMRPTFRPAVVVL